MFHSSPFSEVAFIYPLAHVIRLLNIDHIGWVKLLSLAMVLGVLFGRVYLPWLFIHLSALRSDASRDGETDGPGAGMVWRLLGQGLNRSVHMRTLDPSVSSATPG